jgi:hypothetical protein
VDGRELFRVSRFGVFHSTVATVAELAKIVPLDELAEVS